MMGISRKEKKQQRIKPMFLLIVKNSAMMVVINMEKLLKEKKIFLVLTIF